MVWDRELYVRGGLSAGVKSATDQFSASELEEALDLATSFHVLTDEVTITVQVSINSIQLIKLN